ncbi:DNA-3-methyladenine glycosylase I [Mariniflexile litorale]|uniref:DNA-3-methyladenine glycosylase I n=1 Tax=Mariniflexile litorale TaxID=3045158 RepID=A0AAU7EH03_9FLAO|nr:DNA-3-methyladenine glycosylase I [Mariniflexile sp. KMM 9835]MDQ8211021.1 DNA-3-methyladenine glycosylase I [Mariniflexile sp. KMM 9835]
MAEKHRCGWCIGDTLYETYHDQEWGVPVYDDATIFEFLILETFQAGLSWITILRKRENFKTAFDNFDYKKIATYNQNKVDALLQDSGIVRNKLKVNATITNAQLFMKIQEEFGSFSKYIWGFVDGKPINNRLRSHKEATPTTAISDALSKDLKKRGFKFVGSTVMYAHMQATGMVNDHEIGCFRYDEV